MRRVGGDATILAAEFTVGFSRQESGQGEMGGVGGAARQLNERGRREGGKYRGKLEKTAEGVNNSCRQYDFFM